jgi:hypothetical protein
MGKDGTLNFLEGITNWNNHRPLLWLALEKTKGDVLELGMGEGSSPYLFQYCQKTKRNLKSYENNKDFIYPNGIFVEDWAKIDILKKWSVVLIDHAPAERRHVDAIALKEFAEIVIVHDAEHEGLNYDVYFISKIAEHFKYRLDLVIKPHAAKTVMFSNTIDVSKFTIPKFDYV